MTTNRQTISTESFDTALAAGEVRERGGYHQPHKFRGGHMPSCGCDLHTGKGAYRDMTIDMPDGRAIHYYHQSPVVVREGAAYRLSNYGWKTSTTKERINRYLPAGYHVRQEDWDWYVETPHGRIPFRNGMVIDTAAETVTVGNSYYDMASAARVFGDA